MLTVCIKWQKQVFPGIEIDTSQPPVVFKTQLYTLTGVPPERQKIMVKGGILKDDTDWSTLGLKDGQKLMMIGTADEIVKAPENGPVFVEDLPEEEQAAALGHSAGLYNLGNTCYMNSTLQCLHSVPELKSALLSYSDNARGNGVDQASHTLTVATRNTFGELDQSIRPVAPLHFLQMLRKKYPQFAQQQNNVYMQQLVYTLSQTLTSEASEPTAGQMKELFGIDLVSRVHCAESGEESLEAESVFSLKCHISHEVNHLHEGPKHDNSFSVVLHISYFYAFSVLLTIHVFFVQGLMTELEMVSPSLGRTAIYTRESRINEFPRYLTVQFVRFFWKRESNQKAEILRKVDYPLELDVYDFCSDELKLKLQTPRQVLRDAESAKFGLKVQVKTSSSQNIEGSSTSAGESSSMDIDKADSSVPKKQLTGIYDLIAVLTHKGRSADSGHYVGWVKQDDGKWIEFDDDNPSIRKEEEILKLSGGGDWHMAYICLYKARVI
ncbi:hypothetical protein ZWY2020_011045 [Hordeum vulgare]|nr:hypothetical protein ZWY2020_011045 [Hordeum vulgare]